MTGTIDSHHHIWDPSRRRYPWMAPALDPINRAYELDDLRPELKANRVDSTILVQTVSSLSETVEFLETAAGAEEIAGVVGWVDLTAPDVATTLHDLMNSATGGKLVGIRHQVHDEADPEFLLRDDVQRGIAAVGAAGLVYEFLVRPRELPAALETAASHRSTQFVIDHLGKPDIAGAQIDAWAAAIEPFEDLTNVACKLSGLTTEADWQQWEAAHFEPYVDRALLIFGRERLLFGSDWPVCLLAGTYSDMVDAYRSLVSHEGEDLVRRVFHDNAVRIYDLRTARREDAQHGTG